MKYYKNFAVLWCFFYIFLALVGRVFTAEKEIYPFFRWSLYSKTPNYLEHPFVMVKKIGDSILLEPKNLLRLQSYHNFKTVDMNMNIGRFYDELKNFQVEKSYQGKFLDILPDSSEFVLYIKVFDLSKNNYIDTEVVTKIAEIKNKQIYLHEAGN